MTNLSHPETVKIIDPSGVNEFIVINKSDLTHDHELFVESSESTPEKPAKRAYNRKTQE